LKAELEAAGERFQYELSGLRKEVEELRAFKEGSEAENVKVLKKVDHAEASKNLVVKESKSLVESMKGDAQRFVVKLQEKQDEIDALHKKIKAMVETIEEQETKMLEFGQIEDKHRNEKRQLELQAKKVEAMKNAEKRTTEEENLVMRRQLVDMEKVKKDMSDMKDSMRGMTKDKQLFEKKSLVKTIDRQSRCIEDRDKQIKNKETSIRHLVHVAETTTDANLQLEKEYKRVFAAAKKRQKEMQDQEERARRDIDEAKMAEQNPFYIDTYKRKLIAKEKEIDSLKAKIRRMMVSENRGAMVQKTLQAERSRYEKEIANLRMRATSKTPMSNIKGTGSGRRGSRAQGSLMDLGLSSKTGSGDANKNELDELRTKVKDLENMQGLNLTMKAAFDSLLVQHKALEKSYNAEVHQPKVQPFSPDPLK